MSEISGKHIAVWFSCGAASAVAAKLTLERYGATNTIRIVNNPVIEEDADNQRFLHDIQDWLNHEIEIATNPAYPDCSAVTVWSARSFMSGPHGAPCTIELKKKARQHWEKHNPMDWHVLGFTADEQNRHTRFTETERANVLPVLIEAGYTKQDCYQTLVRAGIQPPAIYTKGYPNANCIGCVKATSPTYWNLVRKEHPEIFAQRAKQSRELGARLVRVNNERIFLDELSPTTLGRPLKTLAIDCSSFCEEQLEFDLEAA